MKPSRRVFGAALVLSGASACCFTGSTRATPGTVSGLSGDATFVTESDPLLAATRSGLLRITLDGRTRELLVPRSAFADYVHAAVTGHTPSWNAFSLEADGAPYLVSLDPVRVEALAPGATRGDAMFSPSGRQLAVVAIWHLRTELVIVDVDTHVTRRAALGPDLWRIDHWTNDGEILLRQWGGPDGCAIVDAATLEHPSTECPSAPPGPAPEAPAPCAELGTIVYQSRTSGGTYDAISLRDEHGGVRTLVTADGWTAAEQTGFDMTSPPDLGDFHFSRSCRYGVFRYDERAYVVEIATGRTALLTEAEGIWPMSPAP